MNAENDLPRAFAEARLDATSATGQPEIEALSAEHRQAGSVALFGLFGCGNLGNDGSLEAMLEFLRRARPRAELFCICGEPDLVAERFGLRTVAIRWTGRPDGLSRKLNRLLLKAPSKLADLVNSFRHVRKADVMIIPGTGILDDFGERPLGMPFDILRWCLAARIMGTKVAFVSIGAGPIDHPVSRWLMIAAARLAHYRSYRDAQSREFMEGAGLDAGDDPVYPDLAFKLPEPTPTTRATPRSPLTIGVGVMSYYGWYGFADGGQAIFDTYVAKIARFVSHLLDEGHNVRLLTGESTDWTAVESVIDRVSVARPDDLAPAIEAEPVHSLHDLMGQISKTDVVVATRYHNIVCALKMAKPTISLGYAKKNDVLMASMGLGEYCDHVERFEVRALIQQFSRLCADRQEFEHMLLHSNNLLRQELERQDRQLLDELI